MTQITVPMSAEHFWLLIICLGLAGATGVIYWALSVTGRTYRRPGWEDIPEGWRGVSIFMGLLWLGLFSLTVIAAYTGVWQMIHPSPEGTGKEVSGLGLGALLAAMLGAPFVIWGTVIRHRTLALSETSMFNDKVNGAVAALYSRRQVTKVIGEGDEAKVLTEWEDDIVQRSAAIDRLEGLMRERPSEAPRIVNMLSVYVRELSREFPAKDHPRQRWLALVESGNYSTPLGEMVALDQLSLSLDDVSIEALELWAKELRPFRTDVEKAVQTLGRVWKIGVDAKDAITIDLRGMNAQGFDLAELDFSGAKLSGARLDGADLQWARMKAADLSRASMEGADVRMTLMDRAALSMASMEGADFSEASLQLANLWAARMEGADFGWAKMDGADLRLARLKGADLSRASMEEANLLAAKMDASTNFTDATLRGASVKFLYSTTTPFSQAQVDQMFGDGTVTLPDGVSAPEHWPKWNLNIAIFEEEARKWQADPMGYRPPTREEVEAQEAGSERE